MNASAACFWSFARKYAYDGHNDDGDAAAADNVCPPCRYCLGAALAMAEMKIFLALLARSYDFTADNDTEWRPALGFYPANGLPLVLTRL